MPDEARAASLAARLRELPAALVGLAPDRAGHAAQLACELDRRDREVAASQSLESAAVAMASDVAGFPSPWHTPVWAETRGNAEPDSAISADSWRVFAPA